MCACLCVCESHTHTHIHIHSQLLMYYSKVKLISNESKDELESCRGVEMAFGSR